MVTPGLYVHSKSNKRYRVLFAADWLDSPPTNPDVLCKIVLGGTSCLVIGPELFREEKFNILFTARWSGNKPCKVNDPCIVYVALYDDGRVSVRSVEEFEEVVQLNGKDVPRFVRAED